MSEFPEGPEPDLGWLMCLAFGAETHTLVTQEEIDDAAEFLLGLADVAAHDMQQEYEQATTHSPLTQAAFRFLCTLETERLQAGELYPSPLDFYLEAGTLLAAGELPPGFARVVEFDP